MENLTKDSQGILKTLDSVSKPRTLELKTPADLVDDWAKSIESDVDRPLTTCIEKFDSDLRNKLRGTVGAYIGYGGTKKSLLALQACRVNVLSHQNNCTGIYSNMEMAIFQFVSRLMDMSFELGQNEEMPLGDFENFFGKKYNKTFNASYEWEEQYSNAFKAKNKEKLKELRGEIKKKFSDMYGSNLYINSQAGMRVEDFNNLVEKAKEKNGKVDMLVIDGLSMMSGTGTETESYTTNSKELKDLAKLHNIYIPLICHLSKGAEKHTREIQRFIRGSEKILDNVDFVIQMSLLIDGEKSTPESITYRTDKGFARLFNKRGSGNTVDTLYNFNKSRLRIEETEEPAEMYEIDLKKKTKGEW